ncbi:MAG: alpha/beta fold hydrolase [Actinobacteria bacterium]|nr:alpha/beta fold hydrolase [Actinomycetota bacterium]
MAEAGRLVPVLDTRLYIEERGSGFPIVLLHGGPGLDHHEFGDYLDPLADEFRLVFVDQRSQGRSDLALEHTWRIENMAEDVVHLAWALELDRYAVLGHSFGAFVALQNAVDFPGMASATIVSSGVASARHLVAVDRNLARFEPEEMRQRVKASWDRERSARTHADVASILADQMPFHFADPLDPRIGDYERRSAGARYAPDVLRAFAERGGAIEVEDRLPHVLQPLLVLAGRHDRACTVEAAEAITAGPPHAELVVFEHGAHMTFVEENRAYLDAVRRFLSGLSD